MTYPIPTTVPPIEVVTDETPSPLPPFATPEQYAAVTGRVPPDGALESASATIRRYCGWHIAPVITETMVIDGSGDDVLALRSLRVSQVLSVTEYGSSNTVSDSLLDFSESGWLQKVGGIFTSRPRGVWVQLVHGYALAEVPDLTATTIITAARAAQNPQGMKGATVGAINVQFSSGSSGEAGGVVLYTDQQTTLDRYRLLSPS